MTVGSVKSNPSRIRRWLARLSFATFVLAITAVGAAAILDRLYPPVLDRYLDRSAMVLDRDGQVLRAFTSADEMWRLPATRDDVSPAYIELLLAYEDRRFDWHPGVDPLAVVRAFGQMLGAGEAVSGASTITMQVARLLEPRPRDLWGKLAEMGRALQLEWHYSKDEILAMYLTLAPYGGNLEGIRAASLAYFGKPPDTLSLGEAAMLVVLPQSPNRWRPDRDMDAAIAARDKVLARAYAYGAITETQMREAMQEPLPETRVAMPFRAAHLAQTLMLEDDGAIAGALAPVIRTTIDGGLQDAAEGLAAQALADLDPFANVAVLIVDNHTREVLAYVGSGDFFDDTREGQIDLVQAIRSPGSTLKPFIYGMGFEDLLIHPQTLIDDQPVRFADYDPHNFDGGFHGRITIREALQASLNVPAVRILHALGPSRLASRLEACGMDLHFPGNDPETPLPLALGGVGVSLFDLTGAYVALANGGAGGCDLAVTEAERTLVAPELPRELLSPAAAWYVADILADAPVPDAEINPAFAARTQRVAYKTGTSYGYRDAWAIGYNADVTIGVWVGRPDGNASPQRTGRDTAAPLLFRLFELMPAPLVDVVPPAPPGVIDRLTDDVPARLVEFGAPPRAPGQAGLVDAHHDLRIDFPVDGSTIELPPAAAVLPLVAYGGVRPLHWLVNGVPIDASSVARNVAWTPESGGQVRITVVDADGNSASAQVWLE